MNYSAAQDQNEIESMLKQAEAHLAAGRLKSAEKIYLQAIEQVPANADLHHVLGLTLLEQRCIDQALHQLQLALQLAPRHPGILKSLGDGHYAAGRYGAAASAYQQVLALDPRNTDAWIQLGNTWHARDDLDQALTCFQSALAIDPYHKLALNNMGKVSLDMGRLDRALDYFEQCLQIDPRYAEGRFNRAVALLTRGDFIEGWREYEWRFKRKNAAQVYPHRLSSPRWQGEPFSGRRLLVHTEQGMGDVLQFIRYLSPVKSMGGEVIVEAHAPLLPLIKSMDAVDELIAFDKERPPQSDHDFHIPLLSLPALFGTTMETIPATVPYLWADGAKVLEWRKLIQGNGFRIGLVWSGSALNIRRNIGLAACRPWFEIPGLHFYSLQKGVSDEPPHMNATGTKFTCLGDRLADFSDTAAAMANLDLIISVDTAAAHLAGALGKPVWVLLPFSPDWRWPPGSQGSPWYPTIRTFRQSHYGDWSEVIVQVGQALNQLKARPESLQTACPGMPPPLCIDDRKDTTYQASMQRGHELLNAGDAAQAKACFHTAATCKPDDPAACYNLGLALQQLNDLEAAAEYYQKALDASPAFAQALANLGSIHMMQGNTEAATTCFEEALRVEPHKAGNHYNSGNAHLARQELTPAVESYQRALQLDPLHHKSLNNLGRALHQLGCFDQSRSCFDRAIELKPDYAEAHLNRAVNALLLGDWDQGWQGYRWRFKCHNWARVYPHHLRSPLWDGRRLDGQKILVHSEQGIGDALQFCRYIPQIKASGGHIIFEVRQSLFTLLSNCSAADEFVVLSAHAPYHGKYDWHFPLGDCPLIFRTTPDHVPNQTPYLFADPGKAKQWRKRLPSKGLNVGLVWSGNDTYRERACALNEMAQLAELEGVNWIGLQKGPAAAFAGPQYRPAGFEVDNWGEEFLDFSDTAAAVTNLDLVISIDTSVAHLAGAMGIPVWTILPAVPDWRWLLNRSDSPWYPSMRLFRQQQAGQWRPVIQQIVVELRLLMAHRSGTDSAASSSRNILQSKSGRMDTHYNLALDLKKNGRIDEAIAAFKELLRLNAENPDLHYDLANAYTSKGQWQEAIRHYRQAVAIDPGNAHAFNNLGVALKNSGDTTVAIAMFQKAIALNADIAEYHNNLGNALQMHGSMKDAIGHFKQAVRLKPDFAEAHYNLGFLLQSKNDLQTAMQHYESALLAKPGFFEAHNNLAVTSHCLGHYEIARTHYDAAVCIQPHNHDTRWNRAMLLLSNREFEEGWREFEHRLVQSGRATNYPFKHAKPRWEGLPLNGKRLLIHDEQGYGDTIQFVRFLPLLKAYGGHILFETRQALVSLLRDFPGIDEIVVRTATQRPEPAYDLYIPLLSLPMLLKTSETNIPSPDGYLHADSKKAEKWRRELKGFGLKVGIVWAGNPAHKNDQNRSCALTHFKTLLDLEGVAFFSLQKDVDPLDWRTGISSYAMTDCGGGIGDFSDTAAIIHNLDLIVSVDTATAHLGGALGKPTWVLLPHVPDWRWMRNRSDSPWYRSMRLFRQKRIGDWESVFSEIKNELRRVQCTKKIW